MNNPNTLILKLVCAVAIAGEVVRAGNLVEVTRSEAKDLLRRGKAELHEGAVDDDEVVTASGSREPDLHPDLADYNADQEAARAAAKEAGATLTDAVVDVGQAAQDAAQDATADAGAGGQPKTEGALQAQPQARRQRNTGNK